MSNKIPSYKQLLGENIETVKKPQEIAEDEFLSEELEENEENTENNQKLFTQDEVNHIVKERLKRVKDASISDEDKKILDDLKGFESELKVKEIKLQCREYLADNGYSNDLLKIIDTNNFEEFKNKIEALKNIDLGQKKVMPLKSTEPIGLNNRAFKDSKHTPKYKDYDY
ncbi:hypothetical protein [Peptoanaerobacter stomatis]|uniref:hypothetical protein n=1 Tax=Peptoanaerobacter stomatis TaxID=796937 RepID=UPI003FA11D01